MMGAIRSKRQIDWAGLDLCFIMPIAFYIFLIMVNENHLRLRLNRDYVIN